MFVAQGICTHPCLLQVCATPSLCLKRSSSNFYRVAMYVLQGALQKAVKYCSLNQQFGLSRHGFGARSARQRSTREHLQTTERVERGNTGAAARPSSSSTKFSPRCVVRMKMFHDLSNHINLARENTHPFNHFDSMICRVTLSE